MPMYDDLREFMEMLDQKGQLVRVTREVDPILEINAIVDRLARKQGPAVLFENVKGSDMPVLGNLFGSHQRVAWTLGAEDFLTHVQQKIAETLTPPEGGGVPDLEGTLRGSFMYAPVADQILPFGPLLGNLPQEVSEAPCKEVVYEGDDIDINRLPLTKLWPQDGDKFITMPMVITRDPETGEINAGTYRMMYLEKNKTCMHWLPEEARQHSLPEGGEDGAGSTGGRRRWV